MIKILAQWEHEIDGKWCRIYMEHDTAVPIAKEMACAFLQYLGNLEDQQKALQAQVQVEQPIEEKPPEEKSE